MHGRIRLQYTSLFRFALKVSEHVTKSILWNSDIFFEEKILSVSYNARICGSLSLLLYQTGSKVKSTWMEGCLARSMVPVSNSEGVSSSCIASISLVVRGGRVSNSVMIWVDQSLMNAFALVYTLRTHDMWVPHFSPKGDALTSFFLFIFSF
jgi:hypothetical protein